MAAVLATAAATVRAPAVACYAVVNQGATASKPMQPPGIGQNMKTTNRRFAMYQQHADAPQGLRGKQIDEQHHEQVGEPVRPTSLDPALLADHHRLPSCLDGVGPSGI
eukprot:5798942-Amphidinium_carterae.1